MLVAHQSTTTRHPLCLRLSLNNTHLTIPTAYPRESLTDATFQQRREAAASTDAGPGQSA